MKDLKRRLVIEGAIKSILCSLFCSFIIMFLISFISWMTVANWYLIGFIISGITFICLSFAFYYFKFRPTDRYIAERLDELGLEERVYTANQFREYSEPIYSIQRNDAKKAVSGLSPKLLKIAMSSQIIILLITSIILGCGMTTVSALAASGEIKSGSDIVSEIEEKNKPVYEVKYKVVLKESIESGFTFIFNSYDDMGGEIIGETDQLVTQGEDATEVTAVEWDDYVFYAWSDGIEDATRIDREVQGNIEITAIFVKLSEDEDGDKNGDGKPSDKEPSDAEPNENENNGHDDTKPDDKSSTDSRNQVLNGNTYYGGKNYDEARSEASDNASTNGNMSDAMKKLIDDYFEAIKKN